MSQAKYYSLRIRRDLVSKLYLQARSLNVPMTQLSDRIVADSLGQRGVARSRLATRFSVPPATINSWAAGLSGGKTNDFPSMVRMDLA